jgi:long-chain acyl-CoA synthetase
VNRSLADDEMLSGCQIHRFLILHKELDADDGELTRTRKVRRRIIEEKFGDLIDALYSGKSEQYTETEVTYEDGRKGKISATLEIRDAAVVGCHWRESGGGMIARGSPFGLAPPAIPRERCA